MKNRISLQSQSEFGHGYVQAVPRSHPQLLFVRQRVVAVGLGQCLSAPCVIVHKCLQLIWPTGLPDGLGYAAFGAKSLEMGNVRPPWGPTADLGVEVHVHGGGGGNARAKAVFRLMGLRDFHVVHRYAFLMRHAELVQFPELLGESARRRTHLQVVGVGEPAGSDDGAVLGQVDVPVDVGLAGGNAGGVVALGVGPTVFRGGASVLVDHELNALVPTRLDGDKVDTGGIKG